MPHVLRIGVGNDKGTHVEFDDCIVIENQHMALVMSELAKMDDDEAVINLDKLAKAILDLSKLNMALMSLINRHMDKLLQGKEIVASMRNEWRDNVVQFKH